TEETRMMPVRYLAAGAALLVLGLGVCLATADAGPAAEDKAPPQMTGQILSAEDVEPLIKEDVKVIQDALKKGDKKSLTKARVVGMLVALYAQTTKQAGLRDQALKVADAITKDNAAAAEQAAAALAGGAKPTGATAEPVALQAQLEIPDLMTVF